MSYAAVARFNSPQEAFIAAGALRAEGFDARVFDQNYTQLKWATRTVIGCRVSVPAGDLAEASVALLKLEAGANLIAIEPDESPPPRTKKTIFALIAFLLGA